MVERIQGEYPFKAEKIALIKKLVDPEEQQVAFARLCEIFSKSWELSKTQGRQLVLNLQGAGFINYANVFFDKGMDPDNVDGAWWNIEYSADAQISAMRVAYHLLTTTNIEQKAELAVSLLNAGHILGSAACAWSVEAVENGESARRAFSETEARALQILKDGQLAGKGLTIDCANVDIDEFRVDHRFDYCLVMVAEPGICDSDTKDLVALYKNAQHFLYLGYGMAMKDAPIIEQREEELYR